MRLNHVFDCYVTSLDIIDNNSRGISGKLSLKTTAACKKIIG